MKFLYKYPQAAFPYTRLVEENRRRNRSEPEFELLDTGIFDDNRYFDVFVEYAKAAPEDILLRIQVINRGPESAELTLLPTSGFEIPGLGVWMCVARGCAPSMPWRVSARLSLNTNITVAVGSCARGSRTCYLRRTKPIHVVSMAMPMGARYVKDGINDYVVQGDKSAVNPGRIGSKAAAHYVRSTLPGQTVTIRLRFTNGPMKGAWIRRRSMQVFAERIAEADEFYAELAPADVSDDARMVQRQAFAGLLWSKQFYHYDVDRWLKGDPAGPEPPQERLHG